MKFSARQIAEFLHGELVGNPSVEVNNLSKIEEGTPGTLSFLANPKYTHYIYQTHASIVLVHKDFEPEHPIEATLIKVDDPYACLAMLLNLVNEATIAKRGIEQPNYVSSSVTLPDDIYLGAFAYIGERVKIGKNVKIYPQTYIGNDVVIGDNVTIFAGVKISQLCHRQQLYSTCRNRYRSRRIRIRTPSQRGICENRSNRKRRTRRQRRDRSQYNNRPSYNGFYDYQKRCETRQPDTNRT